MSILTVRSVKGTELTETEHDDNHKAAILRIENIADLKTKSGDFDEQVIFVAGYYVQGDGGGGDFYWDNLSTATENDGTIIQATGVPTGRWIRIYSGAINVQWFGATGDGVTDDTASITAANAVALSLFFPDGDYSVDEDVIPIGNNRTWFGEGENSRVFSSTSTTGLLNIVGSGVVIKDLNLECSAGSAVSSRTVVNVAANSSRVTIKNCFTDNSRYSHFIACAGLGISKIRVKHNNLDTVRSLIWINNTCNDIEDVKVLFNTANDVYIDGIEFDTPNGTGLTKGVIIGNTLKGPSTGADATGGGIGIGLANVNNVLVTANDVERFTMRGMNIEDTSEDVRVIGNHIKDIGYSIAEIAQDFNDGIVIFAPCNNIKIIGNTIEQCQDSGIEATLGATTSVTNLFIDNNTIDSCGKDNGSGVAADASGILIAGVSSTQSRIGNRTLSFNKISNCLQDGIKATGLQRFVSINDNDVNNNGGYGINLAGNLFNLVYKDNIGNGNTTALMNDYAQTIYLDPVGGNDSNAGTTVGAAKLTFVATIDYIGKHIGENISYTVQIAASALTQWTETSVTIDGFHGEGSLTINGVSTNAVYLDPATGDSFTATNNNLRELIFSRLAGRVNENTKSVFRITGNQGQIQLFSTNTIESAVATSYGIVVNSSKIYTTNALNISAPANPSDVGIRCEHGAIAQLDTVPSGVFTTDTQEATGGKVF